jgi:D-glycero-D-manno-heptose 1,7-bisphosphate phosphatase
MSSQHKAVFLDKDGTLVEDIPFNVDPSLIRMSNHVFEGLRLLQEKEYKIIIVSNQSGVARGFFSEKDLDEVIQKISAILSEQGIGLSGFYYCPHDRPDNCDCRKPKPGMLLKAALDHDIDLSNSWMIGDILDDVEAGNLAGCRSVLVYNNNETQWHWSQSRIPFAIVNSINEAANLILEDQHEFVV